MGPILGGVIGATIGWRWIFWFLCIISGFCLVLVILSLPETARIIVGNGSKAPPPLLRLPIPRLMGRSIAQVIHYDPEGELGDGRKRGWHVPNPCACLKVLSRKDTFIVVTAGGIIYMAYSCLQASLSTFCIEIYGLGQLEAGLIYLPFGFGSIVTTCISGRLAFGLLLLITVFFPFLLFSFLFLSFLFFSCLFFSFSVAPFLPTSQFPPQIPLFSNRAPLFTRRHRQGSEPRLPHHSQVAWSPC